MNAYRATYDGSLCMVGDDESITFELPKLAPPVIQKRPGRPKKKRNRSSKFENETRPLKCSKCSILGHNKRTCPT